AEAVGPEHVQRPRQPAVDRGRQHLHVVGRGDQDARRITEALRHVRDVLVARRVQHVPALGGETFAIELVVAGHAPYVGGDVVLLLENLLRLEYLTEDG